MDYPYHDSSGPYSSQSAHFQSNVYWEDSTGERTEPMSRALAAADPDERNVTCKILSRSDKEIICRVDHNMFTMPLADAEYEYVPPEGWANRQYPVQLQVGFAGMSNSQ